VSTHVNPTDAVLSFPLSSCRRKALAASVPNRNVRQLSHSCQPLCIAWSMFFSAASVDRLMLCNVCRLTQRLMRARCCTPYPTQAWSWCHGLRPPSTSQGSCCQAAALHVRHALVCGSAWTVLRRALSCRKEDNSPGSLAWLGLAWLGLAWLGLAWLGLAWLGLAWLGLAWLGLAWPLALVSSN
jgi:hypothetical protein